MSGVEYVEAIAAVHAAGRRLGTFLTSYDVILSTTLAGPPPKLGWHRTAAMGVLAPRRRRAC